ncbi:MAG: polysaccharide biosynthesis protein PslG [Gaiellaceae bacterium]|nr:polysaccharide biosynthesis protein PslG [Gaiellaceae bacterium]
MRMRVLATCAAACAVLLFAGSGSAARLGDSATPVTAPPIHYGVADDASKYADDGGAWFYGKLNDARLTENRWTLAFNPATPTAITELPFLQRAAPKAQAAGIHVVLALYSTDASSHDPTTFCAWAAQVATTVKGWGIHDFIVWNEPNTRLYWTPQDNAGAAYEPLLARCYDTIHAADSDANVIGMGLSPRASTSSSTEPLVFLRDVGKAYRASGRAAPIMDQLAIHPYPNPNSPTDSPDVGYEVKDRFGIPNLDRVKQAVYDAFNGTKQPTTLDGLTFRIDEIGWQTDTTAYPQQYVNAENVAVVSEDTQVKYLKTMMEKYLACDPTVTDVELFLLVDEKYRNGKDANGVTVGGGWQSGLLTAGGEGVSQPKKAYTDASLTFDRDMGRAACHAGMTTWTPSSASADFGTFDPARSAKVLLLDYNSRTWSVDVTSSVPYRYEFGWSDYEGFHYADWFHASGSAPAGTKTISYAAYPIPGPLLLRVWPEGSATPQDFRSASIVFDARDVVAVYTSGSFKKYISNDAEFRAFLALLQSVGTLPYVDCANGSDACTYVAALSQLTGRTVQSAGSAHRKVYRATVRLKPGARGRPVLHTKGLKPGKYSLTITVKRGSTSASTTLRPLLLDAKGRIANAKHKAPPAKKKPAKKQP